MYKKLAVFSGCIIAIMVSLNGQMTNITGPYINTFVFHLISFLIILLIKLWKKTSPLLIKEIPLILLLPGILNVTSILLNNFYIPYIGVTLSVAISLFGQLVMSSLVENYGLFGMPKVPFHKEKIVGLGIIVLGLITMIVF